MQGWGRICSLAAPSSCEDSKDEQKDHLCPLKAALWLLKAMQCQRKVTEGNSTWISRQPLGKQMQFWTGKVGFTFKSSLSRAESLECSKLL